MLQILQVLHCHLRDHYTRRLEVCEGSVSLTELRQPSTGRRQLERRIESPQRSVPLLLLTLKRLLLKSALLAEALEQINVFRRPHNHKRKLPLVHKLIMHLEYMLEFELQNNFLSFDVAEDEVQLGFEAGARVFRCKLVHLK